MLAKRIIPCLDVKEGRVVKGISFINLKDAGNPVEQAIIYDKQGADELVFLDITASVEKRKIILDVVRKVAECIFIPFTVGGGIKTLNEARAILKLGADKISLNTAAVKNPKLITQIAKKFGSQCVVIAIDAKRRKKRSGSDRPLGLSDVGVIHELPLRSQKSEKEKDTNNFQLFWEVYINGGRTPTGLSAVQWAKKAQSLGAGEILLTSMDCDGQQSGYDLQLLKAIAKNVSIPVIASGGAGKLQHLKDALTVGCADAVLAASIFHFGNYTVKDVKKYLKKSKIPVRLNA